MTRVFVTGGAGVVGAPIVRHLVDDGHEVVALSRREETDRILAGFGARPIRGDILDTAGLTQAMAGSELVYHVAGVNQMCVADRTPMFRANVTGSLNVVRSAQAAGVRRIVYTSSAATIGEERGTVGTESSPHRGRYLSGYEWSKHVAEALVMNEPQIEIVCVNPSSVQGPGRATGTGQIILDLIRGRLPGLVDADISIVAIDDCTRGHLLAADRGVPGERYLLNSFSIGMREAVATLEAVLDRELEVRYLPAWTASVGATAVEAFSRVGRRPPFVCREMVRTLRHGHRYDGTKAQRELGLEYTDARELMARLVDWFRAEGMIDG